VTREKYQKRLEKFFDFSGLDGSTVEEKSKSFIEKIKEEEGNSQWVFNNLKFMQFHLDGVNRRDNWSHRKKLSQEHQIIL
jgi:hypothetical protein